MNHCTFYTEYVCVQCLSVFSLRVGGCTILCMLLRGYRYSEAGILCRIGKQKVIYAERGEISGVLSYVSSAFVPKLQVTRAGLA